jgi:hypothetical protein
VGYYHRPTLRYIGYTERLRSRYAVKHITCYTVLQTDKNNRTQYAGYVLFTVRHVVMLSALLVVVQHHHTLPYSISLNITA